MVSAIRIAAFAAKGTPPPGGAVILYANPRAFALDPSDASANWALQADGSGSSTDEGGWTWLTSGVAADYEAMATMISGSFSSGNTIDAWHGLGLGVSWTVSQTSFGTNTASATVKIRRASDSVVVESAVVSWSATVDI